MSSSSSRWNKSALRPKPSTDPDAAIQLTDENFPSLVPAKPVAAVAAVTTGPTMAERLRQQLEAEAAAQKEREEAEMFERQQREQDAAFDNSYIPSLKRQYETMYAVEEDCYDEDGSYSPHTPLYPSDNEHEAQDEQEAY
jgi:hypothetical protein